MKMFTDTLFLSSDQQLAELVSRYVDVYNYLYIHQNRDLATELPITKLSTLLSQDVSFFFNNTDYKENPTPYDKSMTKIMITYWANFAKYRTPSPTISDILRSKSYVDQLSAVESAIKHLITFESIADHQHIKSQNEDLSNRTNHINVNILKNEHVQLTEWEPYSTERVSFNTKNKSPNLFLKYLELHGAEYYTRAEEEYPPKTKILSEKFNLDREVKI